MHATDPPPVRPQHTALLVIDPVNDFLHEDGAAWEMTKSMVKKNDVVARGTRLAADAHQAGADFHADIQPEPGDVDGSMSRYPRFVRGRCTAGAPGADLRRLRFRW